MFFDASLFNPLLDCAWGTADDVRYLEAAPSFFVEAKCGFPFRFRIRLFIFTHRSKRGSGKDLKAQHPKRDRVSSRLQGLSSEKRTLHGLYLDQHL